MVSRNSLDQRRKLMKQDEERKLFSFPKPLSLEKGGSVCQQLVSSIRNQGCAAGVRFRGLLTTKTSCADSHLLRTPSLSKSEEAGRGI